LELGWVLTDRVLLLLAVNPQSARLWVSIDTYPSETPCDDAVYRERRYSDKAMIIDDSNSPEQKESKRLRFDRYVLDLDRGCLLLDGGEIALRPKTFAVLRYLIENSGRLISKDELFAAVWPKLTVTDDALVQSMGELRRGLGDDGPRLIKTVPRRGYRLESAVSVAVPVDPSATHAAGDLAPPYDGDRASKPLVRPYTSKLLTTAFTGWRRGLFVAQLLSWSCLRERFW
jgi:DNA-binding winged helix-turn-helix (wHTH) protein